MTVAPTRASGPLAPPLLRRAGLPVVLIVVLAAVLRAAPYLLPGNLTGVLEYDDGVHYAAAAMLLAGHLPYRDFVFLHPPGVVVALTPFALLGRWLGDPVGLAAARLAIVGVAMANTWLVARLAHRALGRTAAIAAAAVYALQAGAIAAERTVLLEPLVNLLCLLAVEWLLARDRPPPGDPPLRRIGLLLGVAAGVKLFAAVYLVATLLWLGRSVRRTGGPLVAGWAIGFAVVVAPFALWAPAGWLRQTILVQLTRPDSGIQGAGARLIDMVGWSAAGWPPPPVAVLLVAGAMLAAVLGWGVTRGSPYARFWCLVAVLTLAVFAVSAPYYAHYGGFLAPAFAAVVAVAAARAAQRPFALGGLALLGVLGVAQAAGMVRGLTPQADLGRVTSAVPTSACMFADKPTLAISADLLPRRQGCWAWVDPRGDGLARLHGRRRAAFYPAGFAEIDDWQAEVQRRLASADYALLEGSPADHPYWSEQTRRYVTANFVRRASLDRPRLELWQRQ